jgi:hypothetical protein
MAGNGPLPAAHRQRERDTARRDRDVVTVVPDGVLRGPELPDDHGYSPQTVAYYDTWRRSPQAQVFEDTDWLALHLILPLYEGNLRKPSAAAVSEIRLTTAALGGTYADRLRVAKIRVQREDEGADAVVTPLHAVKRNDLRDRLRSGGKARVEERPLDEQDDDEEPAPF